MIFSYIKYHFSFFKKSNTRKRSNRIRRMFCCFNNRQVGIKAITEEKEKGEREKESDNEN